MNSLKTSRLILRKFALSDAEDAYSNYCSDPRVTEFLSWDIHKNILETKRIISSWIDSYKEDTFFQWAIEFKENHQIIGSIGVGSIEDNIPEIGYSLGYFYWGKGIMSEALHAVEEYLFSLGYKAIRISTNKDNIRSNKLIIKNGYTFEKEAPALVKGHNPLDNVYIKRNS